MPIRSPAERGSAGFPDPPVLLSYKTMQRPEWCVFDSAFSFCCQSVLNKFRADIEVYFGTGLFARLVRRLFWSDVGLLQVALSSKWLLC